MSKTIDQLTFTGQSGRRYDLRLYVWETRFKAFPAVYVVTERTIEPGSAPVYNPIFVGTTSDLSTIFDGHPHQDCFDLYYANTIAILQETDAVSRVAIVHDLVATLQPPCNSSDAEGKGL